MNHLNLPAAYKIINLSYAAYSDCSIGNKNKKLYY